MQAPLLMGEGVVTMREQQRLDHHFFGSIEAPMPTIQQVRRANARLVMQQIGGPSSFAHRIDRDPSYVSQITGASHSKAIGDRMARHIEQCLGKPEGWLDEQHEPAPAPEASEVAHTAADFVTLPVAKMAKSTEGEPVLTTEGEVGGVPRDVLERIGITTDQAMLVEVHGDAHGLALPDGSLVAVNKEDTDPREGKVYAIQDSDMLRVRILVPEPGGGLVLRTFNRADYPDEHLDPAQVARRIRVLGRVFWSATRWQ